MTYLWVYALEELREHLSNDVTTILPTSPTMTDAVILDFVELDVLTRRNKDINALLRLIEVYSGAVVSFPRDDLVLDLTPGGTHALWIPSGDLYYPNLASDEEVPLALQNYDDPTFRWRVIADLFNIACRSLPRDASMMQALKSKVTNIQEIYKKFVFPVVQGYGVVVRNTHVSLVTDFIGPLVVVYDGDASFHLDVTWDTASAVVADSKTLPVTALHTLLQAALTSITTGSLMITFNATLFSGDEASNAYIKGLSAPTLMSSMVFGVKAISRPRDIAGKFRLHLALKENSLLSNSVEGTPPGTTVLQSLSQLYTLSLSVQIPQLSVPV